MKLRLIVINDSFDDIFVESVFCGTKIDTCRFIRSVRSTVEGTNQALMSWSSIRPPQNFIAIETHSLPSNTFSKRVLEKEICTTIC